MNIPLSAGDNHHLNWDKKWAFVSEDCIHNDNGLGLGERRGKIKDSCSCVLQEFFFFSSFFYLYQKCVWFLFKFSTLPLQAIILRPKSIKYSRLGCPCCLFVFYFQAINKNNLQTQQAATVLTTPLKRNAPHSPITITRFTSCHCKQTDPQKKFLFLLNTKQKYTK